LVDLELLDVLADLFGEHFDKFGIFVGFETDN
jgi:hypothetical protein